MSLAALLAIAALALLFVFFVWVPFRTWALYLAIMAIDHSGRGPKLTGEDFARFLRDPYRWPTAWLFVRGVLYDWLLNLVPATVVFLDRPRELFFTKRMERYLALNAQSRLDRWRQLAARAVCRHVLNPYAPGKCHCRPPLRVVEASPPSRA